MFHLGSKNRRIFLISVQLTYLYNNLNRIEVRNRRNHEFTTEFCN